MPKSIGQDTPLYAPDTNDPVVGESLERSGLDESHQESETNEDHHVDILVWCIFVLHVVFGGIVFAGVHEWVSIFSELAEETPEQNGNSLSANQDVSDNIDSLRLLC
jgi:hypothetical protein